MPVNLIAEDDLREALRPHRPDPKAFEAKVRERLETLAKEQEEDPLAGFPPLLRGAAALVPIQLIAGGKVPAALATKLIPAGGAYKLLGYLAFPAISLFVLMGAAVFGVGRIRSTRGQSGAGPTSDREMYEATRRWWDQHKLGFWAVFAATMVMQWIGATWLLFLMYIVSLGVLLLVITALAKVGLGNRMAVGQWCLTGLMLLAQLAGFATTGNRDIHFVDQHVIAAVFFAGAMFLAVYMTHMGLVPPRVRKLPRWLQYSMFPAIVVPMIVWFMSPVLWPPTPARIKRYVESAEFTMLHYHGDWQQWETVASWTIDRKLEPDLSAVRRQLDQEIAGSSDRPGDAPDPVILRCGLQVGLIGRDELEKPPLAELYKKGRSSLFDRPQDILSKEQFEDYQARAAKAQERERMRAESDVQPANKAVADKNDPAAEKPGEADVETQPLRTDRRDERRHERHAEIRREAVRRHATIRREAAERLAATRHEPRAPTVNPELRPILSLDAIDWVLRAAVLRDELTDEDRDYLASRLQATIEEILAGDKTYYTLESLLVATRQRAVIGRPVDPDQYRTSVHAMLRKFHCQTGRGFMPVGGFGLHLRPPEKKDEAREEPVTRWLMEHFGVPVGAPLESIEATAFAVELMQIYGVPPGLDLNWVRSYVKPAWNDQFSDKKWVAAVTSYRIDSLPGAAPPTWLEVLYYERSLLAAMVLVGLCIYATFASPMPKIVDSGTEPSTGLKWEGPAYPWKKVAVTLVCSLLFAAVVNLYVFLYVLKRPELPARPARHAVSPPIPRTPIGPPAHRPHRANPAPPAE